MWRRLSMAARWRRVPASLMLGLALLLAACAPTGGASSTPTPTKTPAPPCLTWRIVSSPATAQNQNSVLSAVSALSPSSAWAVGVTYQGEGPATPVSTLIEQWDGTAWHVVTSPGSGRLNGVAALSAHDAWTVGLAMSAQGGESRAVTLVERWNGAQWSVIPSPSPGAAYSALTSVAVVGATDAWAVGSSRGDSDVTLPLIERWDGTAWKVVASPALPGVTESDLSAIARIPGASQLWAVGYALKGPRPAYEQALIERWDGSAWQTVASPALPNAPFGSQLTSVVALSATDAWAVGSYTASDHTSRTLIVHWDGTAWKFVASPDVWGALSGVAAIGSRDVRAVGGSFANGSDGLLQPLALRWNGATWEKSAPPSPDATVATDLLAIAADSAGGFWAAGYTSHSGFSQPLIERCA